MAIKKSQLVFVKGYHNYPEEMSFNEAVLENKDIIFCNHCEEPAVVLDLMFPHSSELNACEAHAESVHVSRDLEN